MTMTFLERFNEATEGLKHVSTGGYLRQCSMCVATIGLQAFNDSDDPDVYYCEPIFSWRRCDTCNSELGGYREVGHAWDSDGNLIHLACCTDCVMWLANGELPSD